MQLARFPNNILVLTFLVLLYSCANKKQVNETACKTISLPSNSTIRCQYALLPDTNLNQLRFNKLAIEIAISNNKSQAKFNLLSDTTNINRCFLVSDRFRRNNSSNDSSIYSAPLCPYKIIKLKSSYLIINYYQTELTLIYYLANSDSLYVDDLSKINTFIGAVDTHTDSISYYTFAYSGAVMGVEFQKLSVLAYSNYTNEYKLTTLFINEKVYGIYGECDSLYMNNFSIDYERSTITTLDLKQKKLF